MEYTFAKFNNAGRIELTQKFSSCEDNLQHDLGGWACKHGTVGDLFGAFVGVEARMKIHTFTGTHIDFNRLHLYRLTANGDIEAV